MFSAHVISHGETPSKVTKRVHLFVDGVLDLQTSLWLFINHGGFVVMNLAPYIGIDRVSKVSVIPHTDRTHV